MSCRCVSSLLAATLIRVLEIYRGYIQRIQTQVPRPCPAASWGRYQVCAVLKDAYVVKYAIVVPRALV